MSVENLSPTRDALRRRENVVRVLGRAFRSYSANCPAAARSDLARLVRLGAIDEAEQESIQESLLPLRRRTIEYVPQVKKECWTDPNPDDAA